MTQRIYVCPIKQYGGAYDIDLCSTIFSSKKEVYCHLLDVHHPNQIMAAILTKLLPE